MNQWTVLDTLMLIGLGTWMNGSQCQEICLRTMVQLSAGEVKSKRVALSTAEAEYMTLASIAQEEIWTHQLLPVLSKKSKEATLICEDSLSEICLAKNPQLHGQTKHIGIKFHFIGEHVERGNMKLKYRPTEEMVADMLTKGRSSDQFVKLHHVCGVKKMAWHFTYE